MTDYSLVAVEKLGAALAENDRLRSRNEGQALRIKALGKNIDDLLDDREVLVATLRNVRELAMGLELTDRVMAILRHIDTAPLNSPNEGEAK